ncbi:serine/threonine protein phosphatase [Synechococcus sp. PCC 7502]|uniref:PP2C family protein-serine/threonine phosphatase n=1 Tax=Synechococcus sp. PCC 7502 TaxID=1173263 RepID=UPI00029FF598|nr:protein phosphatase 2C domain-containing protein [Synechococcus sp. PCC 7502]AFY72261.1 serine/threonine protein phosphatase [Synechococcus sp. PCC 7502]
MVKDDQSTFISQRYLWAVGLAVEDFPPSSILSDRYRVVESQVVSDTQIFKFPDIPDEIPPYVSAYLRLAKLPLHIPRPYGLVKVGEDDNAQELLLLDRAPISPEGKLYANLRDRWIEGSALRQIDLMGQVLRLWQPLLDVGMVSTLLTPDTLRVFGPWVRILELIVDEDEVKLSDLGNLWIDWLEHAKPEISDALADFCFGLSRSEFSLDQAIATLDQIAQKQAETLPINIRIASGTDTGPRRDHNEDSCYPTPERQKRSQQPKVLRDRLAIICDGLGGHEGGEVASDMAIKTIEKELEVVFTQMDNNPNPFSPQEFIQKLDRVVRIANDQIVALNDRYQKQAQQRMGTTLVMAVIPYPHEVYVVNIGDSRLYWIHSESSDQVTVDDDVCTRDVILGYSFPAIAAQRVDGGSLIQALGTRSSDVLYPHIQRLPLDEDCLLLLCSDGLSDYDRIEEMMDVHIRPILTNNLPLHESVKKLIDLANERNGHDNVTVALMRSQLAETEDIEEEDTLPTEADQFHGFFGDDLPLSAPTSSSVDEENESATETSAPQDFNLRLVITGVLVLVLLVTGAIAISQFTPIKDLFQPSVPTNGKQ